MTAVFDHHDTEGLYKLYEARGDDHEYGLRIGQNPESLTQVLREAIQNSEP